MKPAGLHIVEAPFVPEFGKRGELRQPVGKSGRVHLDRWLPFIVLHRSPDPSSSIARRVAINSPAYLIWSPEDDRAATQAFAAVAVALQKQFGRILVMDVEDAAWATVPKGSQRLPAFDIRAGATAAGTRGGRSIASPRRWAKVRIDLRKPERRHGRGGSRPDPPRRRPVRTAVGGHPADPPRGRDHLLSPADPRARGRDRRCAAPGVLRLHGGQRRRRARPISARSGEARSSRRRSRRRQTSSTRSRAASISCCRSRRSTAARRWSASSPTARLKRRNSATAR